MIHRFLDLLDSLCRMAFELRNVPQGLPFPEPFISSSVIVVPAGRLNVTFPKAFAMRLPD